MASIVVQLGQCGNQIGTQLFSILHSDSISNSSCKSSLYYQKTMDRYFYEQEAEKKLPLARAVLIDMETKVIECSISDAKRDGNWLYDPLSVHKGCKGSGNNWANGFCQHGPKSREGVLNVIQREVEKCDNLEGFLILMSVAGGTGSGLGTYITDMLREEYPTANIVNPIIWPYASGEVIVQNYNALLTTSHLYESSDALIMLLNDHLHQICSKLLQLKDISFKDLNKVAGHVLASILQPAVPYKEGVVSKDFNFHSQYCSLSDLCGLLTPQSDYRLLSIKCVPQMPERSHAFTNYLWVGLLKYLRQMVVTDSPIEEGMDWENTHKLNKCLANLLILRGRDLSSSDCEIFSWDDNSYVDWVPLSMRQSIWYSPHPFNRYEKSCSIVSNSQSCVKPVNTVTGKAWNMYNAKAYIHQYSQFGLSEDQFMESFVKVEHVLKSYSMLM